MSIKLCLLKTGETVIGDVKEIVDKAENKTVGFKISAPYIINYEYEKILNVENIDSNITEEEKNKNSQINFKFWAPLAKQRDFNFPDQFVEVIYEPHESVIQSYITILEHWAKENTRIVTAQTEKTVLTSGIDDTPSSLT